MPWLDQVDAVIQAWYPGQEAGHAIADVLSGRVEPTGRLPQSFPRKLTDAPNITDDPRAYPGLNGHVRYDEKLNIGYRHHDATGIAPLFPFGFGLGYTEFVIKDPMVEKFGQDAGGFVVHATVANVGKQSGKTVVQLYVAPLNAPVVRPQKELKGFSKVTVDANPSVVSRPGHQRTTGRGAPFRLCENFACLRLGRLQPPRSHDLPDAVRITRRRFLRRQGV
jgi:beta-glucosidase